MPGPASGSTELPTAGKLGQMVTALEAQLGQIESQRSLTTIGAVVSSDLLRQALILIVVGSLGIVAWITYRFRDVKFGVTALVSLLHDVIVVVGSFAILGTFFHVEIDALFVTAMLTVIGFSVHDTIVVFDRIRENKARHIGEPFDEIVNHSILQTFGRSITTSLTVLLTLLSLFLFGGSAISDFVLALLIGIVIGTYSSIFVASPLLVDWYAWEDRRRARRQGSARPAPAEPRPDPCVALAYAGRRRPVESQVTAAWHPDPVLEPRFRWSFPETRHIDPDLADRRARPWPGRADDGVAGASGRPRARRPHRVVRRAARRAARSPSPAGRGPTA